MGVGTGPGQSGLGRAIRGEWSQHREACVLFPPWDVREAKQFPPQQLHIEF